MQGGTCDAMPRLLCAYHAQNNWPNSLQMAGIGRQAHMQIRLGDLQS